MSERIISMAAPVPMPPKQSMERAAHRRDKWRKAIWAVENITRALTPAPGTIRKATQVTSQLAAGFAYFGMVLLALMMAALLL